MANFTGTLNINEWNAGLFNAYTLMAIQADNLDGLDGSLASMFKTEGGKYNDKIVFSDVDIVSSRIWDPTDTNVLAMEERPALKQQEIVVNKKRQIAITIDKYLSRRAWMDEGSFSQYNSLVGAQVVNTKRVYDKKLVDVAIGTMESSKGSQQQTVVIPELTGQETFEQLEAHSRITGQRIANKLANIYAEVKDASTAFNDNGFVKSFDKSKLMVIWNQDYLNSIQFIDLPTVFHKDGLFDFTGKELLAKYMGTDSGAGTADGSTHRAKNEYKIPVDATGKYSATGNKYVLVRPGDILPEKTPIVAVGTEETTSTLDTSYVVDKKTVKLTVEVNNTVHAYVADASIICKIVAKPGVKYFSDFETETEFNNTKNHTRNMYLTWLFAEPQYLAGYPLITLRKA